MLSITGVMVLPAYLASTGYLWKLVEDGEYTKISSTGRAAALFTSLCGTGYAVWLLYAASVKYLFMAVIFLALGIPVFMRARREQAPGKAIFSAEEKIVVTLLVLFALAALCMMCRGHIHV